ncbi:MAG: peptidase S41, partial [Bacteroidetes bacterium]|nr:peptidase S41 [Bacteroidota bacterium]
DSLKVAFKTKKGRTVYDGGGIEPDIYIEPYLYSNITISLITKYLIFDFATKFRSQHPSIASAKTFTITDDIFNEFLSFILDKDYDYSTKSEQSLEELKEITEKEKYYNDIKVEYDALKSKMMHNKKADIEKFKEEIKSQLREEIVSRYYYQKGRLEVSFYNDQEVKKALEIFNDSATYKGILDGSITLNKEKKASDDSHKP